MKSKNICKFVSPYVADSLETNCFIYESEPEAITKGSKLKNDRLILAKSGNGVFSFDAIEVPFSAGDIIFGFSEEYFEVKCKPPCEYLYIDFRGARADSLFRRFGINKINRLFKGFEGLIPIVHESLSRASDENIDLASESMLIYIFSRLTSNTTEYSNLIGAVLDITEEEFTNPELSLAIIAKELSYNPKYLSHAFKEKMGIGYSEYLRTLRIKHAIALFDQGIDSVKNVAFLSGFSDSLYFSTVFKKITGVSPKDYKNNRS